MQKYYFYYNHIGLFQQTTPGVRQETASLYRTDPTVTCALFILTFHFVVLCPFSFSLMCSSKIKNPIPRRLARAFPCMCCGAAAAFLALRWHLAHPVLNGLEVIHPQTYAKSGFPLLLASCLLRWHRLVLGRRTVLLRRVVEKGGQRFRLRMLI